MKRLLCLGLILSLLLVGCKKGNDVTELTYELDNGETVVVGLSNALGITRTEGDPWFFSKNGAKVGMGFFELADQVWVSYYTGLCNMDYAHIIDKGEKNGCPYYMAEIFLDGYTEYDIVTYIPGSGVVCTNTADDARETLTAIHDALTFECTVMADENRGPITALPDLYDYLSVEFGGPDSPSESTSDTEDVQIEYDPASIEVTPEGETTLDLSSADEAYEMSVHYTTTIGKAAKSSDIVGSYKGLPSQDTATKFESYWTPYATDIKTLLESTELFDKLDFSVDSTISRSLQAYGDRNCRQYVLHASQDGYQTVKYIRLFYNQTDANPDWSAVASEVESLTGIRITGDDLRTLKALSIGFVGTSGSYAVTIDDPNSGDSITFSVSDFSSELESWQLQVTSIIAQW